MRFRKTERYLLLLALLFVLAVLRRDDLPGEEMLPDLYRAAVHEPLVAQVVQAGGDRGPDVIALRNELETARREIRVLKEQLARRDDLARYFRALEWEAEPLAIPGWVFSVDKDTFRRRFTAGCGTRDGVRAGMPVVSGTALLGVVRGAKPNYCVVQRVDDPNFRLEVEIETAGGVERGVARGDGAGGLDVLFVRQARAIEPEAPVFTSRYHTDIPPGLLVGRVAEVGDLDQNGILEVSVTPAAVLGRVEQVDVLARAGRRR